MRRRAAQTAAQTTTAAQTVWSTEASSMVVGHLDRRTAYISHEPHITQASKSRRQAGLRSPASDCLGAGELGGPPPFPFKRLPGITRSQPVLASRTRLAARCPSTGKVIYFR